MKESVVFEGKTGSEHLTVLEAFGVHAVEVPSRLVEQNPDLLGWAGEDRQPTPLSNGERGFVVPLSDWVQREPEDEDESTE